MALPIYHRSKRIGLRTIVILTTFAAMAYQLRPLQHSQVLGDGGLGHTCIASQCVDGLFALSSQLLEDGPARWIGEGAEHVVGINRLHVKIITI